MFKAIIAKILGKGTLAATTTNEALVDTSGGLAIGGHIAHDSADVGNPVKVGGVARTTNPTAVGNVDRVNAFFDDVGRQVFTPYQVRDLISTARVSITTTGESALFAGAAATFHDLLYVSAANESTLAVSVVLRDATGGGPVINLEVPASNTVSLYFPSPIPQNALADTWTAAVTDFVSDGTTTNGTVVVTALFAKNV